MATRLELKGCMPCPCEKPRAGPTPQREEPALGSEQPAGLRTVGRRPGVRAQRQPPPCTGPVSEAAMPVATGLPGAVAGIVLPTGVSSDTAGPGDLGSAPPTPPPAENSGIRVPPEHKVLARSPPKPKPQVCSLSCTQGLRPPHTGL
ncbi:unnamed protein product [Rangifer tarandus platyrhynchus]|uniref:Uncharacterized protein n=2 Tax=Rangifer tarandus platyrhynchus TaxID=3082113 RepID=A0ABN8ZGA1_RANTA|nr:unnamed protein product [Rangifer tarandus platyrhynchus]CAI9708434.1 unnamed protein product [Rangifer tarandus platyrhynchus]